MDVQEGSGYERLGAKRLMLIDVLAQSVWFERPGDGWTGKGAAA
jgi:hypothetical protein